MNDGAEPGREGQTAVTDANLNGSDAGKRRVPGYAIGAGLMGTILAALSLFLFLAFVVFLPFAPAALQNLHINYMGYLIIAVMMLSSFAGGLAAGAAVKKRDKSRWRKRDLWLLSPGNHIGLVCVVLIFLGWLESVNIRGMVLLLVVFAGMLLFGYGGAVLGYSLSSKARHLSPEAKGQGNDAGGELGITPD